MITKKEFIRNIKNNLLFFSVMSIQIIFILIFSFFEFGIDLENLRLVNVGMVIFISLFSRTISSYVSKKKYMQDSDIQTLLNDIYESNKLILDKNEMPKFRELLKLNNKLTMLFIIRDKVDIKLNKKLKEIKAQKLSKKRKKITELINLLESKKYKEYIELENCENTLNYIKVNNLKYDRIKTDTLFNNKSHYRYKKHSFINVNDNTKSLTIKNNLLPFMFSLFTFSLFTILVITQNNNFIVGLILFLTYTMTSISSYFTAMLSMKNTILIYFKSTLDGRFEIIKEISSNMEFLND